MSDLVRTQIVGFLIHMLIYIDFTKQVCLRNRKSIEYDDEKTCVTYVISQSRSETNRSCTIIENFSILENVFLHHL